MSAVLHEIDFFYDPISPYAHLAFERLPQALMGLSVVVRYKPVLFAALLKAHGQLGPAEIPAKRDWTYRQVLWLAQHHGLRLDLPAAHPFNPLPLLRLGLASATDDAPGETSRYVTEALFRHVWHGGGDPVDPARLAASAKASTTSSTCATSTCAPTAWAESSCATRTTPSASRTPPSTSSYLISMKCTGKPGRACARTWLCLSPTSIRLSSTSKTPRKPTSS